PRAVGVHAALQTGLPVLDGDAGRVHRACDRRRGRPPRGDELPGDRRDHRRRGHRGRGEGLLTVAAARHGRSRRRVLIVEVSLRCADGWPYRERCGNGHEWGRGLVLTTWEPCLCRGAQTLHPDQTIWGYFVVACREPGCESVFYDPPHEPGRLAGQRFPR